MQHPKEKNRRVLMKMKRAAIFSAVPVKKITNILDSAVTTDLILFFDNLLRQSKEAYV